MEKSDGMKFLQASLFLYELTDMVHNTNGLST